MTQRCLFTHFFPSLLFWGGVDLSLRKPYHPLLFWLVWGSFDQLMTRHIGDTNCLILRCKSSQWLAVAYDLCLKSDDFSRQPACARVDQSFLGLVGRLRFW